MTATGHCAMFHVDQEEPSEPHHIGYPFADAGAIENQRDGNNNEPREADRKRRGYQPYLPIRPGLLGSIDHVERLHDGRHTA